MNLLNKTNYIKIGIIFYFFFSFLPAKSVTIFTIAKVNNQIITNIDFENEKKIFLLMNNQTANKNMIGLNNYLLQNLINRKIKEIEIRKTKIEISEEEILENANIIYKKVYNQSKETNSDQKKDDTLDSLKEVIKNNVRIELSWKRLIFLKF
ncbi:MAG: hypothetical protein VW907_06375, partial [Opitutae bacterium]